MVWSIPTTIQISTSIQFPLSSQPVARSSTIRNHKLNQTPIKVDRLSNWLEGYEYKDYICDSLRFGFDIGWEGVYYTEPSKNAQIIDEIPWVADEMIRKEADSARVAGPFVKPPFMN